MNLAALVRILTAKGLSPEDIADVVEAVQKPEPKPRAKNRARFVPEDWHPSEKHHAKAVELGISEDAFTVMLASFREWEFKDGKTNFDLAFHRWLRTNAGRANGNRPAIIDPGAERHAQRVDSMLAGAAQALNGGGRQRWRL